MDFPTKQFDVIYADPPWKYGTEMHNTIHFTYGAKYHYPTMSLDEMKVMRVRRISKQNCLLFIWATSPLLREAIVLGTYWGFEYITIAFVWLKSNKANPGNYTMSRAELVLVFKRGKIPEPRGARNIEQYLYVPRTEHSTKPVEIKNRITEMFPTQDKIELFARNTTQFDVENKWEHWGNEVEN